ncbi:MAG: dockerin type I repeat-containing protein [Clostridia bacterium]|nr:dockerin type I repeat-containing protein [Clostridia bacterium]
MKQVTILRRFVAVLLALMLTLSLIPFVATAAPVSEAEPNNSSTPNAVPLNTAINGVCSSAGISGDEDWYSFNLPEDGYITLNFQHKALKSGDWTMQIYGSDNGSYLSEESVYDVTDMTTRRVGLPAGKYYVRVYTNREACVGVAYTLTVNFTATDTYEREKNGQKSTPNAIPLNTAIGGNCSSAGISGDDDWYSFKLPEAGYVTLNFKHQALKTGEWMMQIYGEDSGTFLSEESVYDVTDMTTRRVGLDAGKYYVRVYTNKDACVGVEYLMTVNFTATETYEQEPNGQKSTPNAIPLDTTIGGNCSSSGISGDDDWYSFRLDKDGKVAINFCHEALKRGSWIVQLRDETNQTLLSQECVYDEVSTTTQRIGLEAGKYYLRIYTNVEPCEGVEYTFKVLTKGMLGDVDSDGSITSTDARLTLQYYAGKIGENDLDLSVADVDGDGKYTSTDARLILQYYAGKIEKFPAEG